MQKLELNITINGRKNHWHIAPDDRLSDVLRREGFFGVKIGCYTGDCGTCTVLLDNEPILACVMLAAQAEGMSLTTIEGLAKGPKLHPIQEAFLDQGAIQCGFCSPAMMLSAKSLLEKNSDPTETEAREVLSATLCRCTGYDRPVQAILDAAKRMKESK
jgi:aerobic-type carbon monoxide dehydrogenase small subunit (CoxS/CutS family)